MKQETNLCMSCMEPIPPGAALTHAPGECPHCNWIDNGVYLASYLYPRTFLASRYIVGKLISYNGEGALYAGFDTLTDTKITIKEYMPDALCSRARDVLPLSVNSGELPLYKTYLSEFIELNRSLQSFGSSPRIQKITDVFSENNTAYAIHEDVSGISLADYLRNVGGKLTVEQVKELFPPIFTTLSRINIAGTIHRGISPKTIFVNLQSGAPLLYISDFAITAARIYGSKINSEVFAGYAAPEQHNWVERHGDWTDVYGLAALLYNVLTGVVPQDAPSRLIEDRLIEPMLINGLIPGNVSKAIMRGMELTAERRIKSIDEFSHLLWGPLKPVSATVGDTLAFTSTAGFTNANNNISSAKYVPDYSFDELDEDDEIEERLSLRRMRREKKRKVAMITALTTVSALVVVFLIFIIFAVANPDVFMFTPRERPTIATGASDYERYVPETNVDGSVIIDPTQEAEVTNFVGVKFSENLRNRFNFLEFEFIPEYSDDEEKPRMEIFHQSIEPGEIVPFGTKIVIKYSLGPEYIQMPNYAGMTVAELTDLLVELGVNPFNIEVRDVEDPFYSSEREGMITVVNFEPGSRIRATSFPGDLDLQADTVIIFKAAPMSNFGFNPGDGRRPGRDNDNKQR